MSSKVYFNKMKIPLKTIFLSHLKYLHKDLSRKIKLNKVNKLLERIHVWTNIFCKGISNN